MSAAPRPPVAPLRDWLVLRDRRPALPPDFDRPLGRVQARSADEASREAARTYGARVVVTPMTRADRARLNCDAKPEPRNGSTRGRGRG